MLTAPCPGPGSLDPALLQLPLRVLNLTVRAVHCLSDVSTIAALLDCTEVQLVARRNFGRTSLLDVRRKLVQFVVDRGGAASEPPIREAFYDPHPSFSALWGTPPQERTLRVVVAELLELLADPDRLRRVEPWPYSTTAIGPPRAIDVLDVPLQDVVEAIFICMKPRERRILERRYGGLATEPATLAEVGRELGLTRERVRQIIQACLARLDTESERQRRLPFMTRLRECLEEVGGVIHERQLAADLYRRFPPPHPDLGATLRILMSLDPQFQPTGRGIWGLEAASPARVPTIQEAFHARLLAAARPVALVPFLEELCRESNGELSLAFLQACLDAEPRIYRSESGLCSLVAWRQDGSTAPDKAARATRDGSAESSTTSSRRPRRDNQVDTRSKAWSPGA